MTVSSPDTPWPVATTQLNVPDNTNTCPTNGTGPIPSNGVVFAENANGSRRRVRGRTQHPGVR